MAFPTKTTFTFNHSAEPDVLTPGSITSSTLKADFDSRGQENLNFINAILAVLVSVVSGSSGAENIGSAPITGVTGSTIYAQLGAIKALLDAATAAGAIVTAQLANGSVTNPKVAAGIDSIKIGNGDVTNTILSYLNSLTSNAQTQLNAKIPLTQIGAASGVASLDTGAKVPISQLPDAVVGALEYQGTWNASTNTPALTSTPTTIKGYYYVVSTAGTQFSISFDVGDWIVSNGTVWQKIDNTDAVPSVFGRLGNVVANANDYTWAQINKAISSIADLTTRSASDINSGTLPVAQIPTGIPASSIGLGTVTNAILAYLANVTSDIQTQFTNKAPLTHVGAGGSSQHPDATTLLSGFISAADLLYLRSLVPSGLASYSVPVGQAFLLWGRYSLEQDATTGEMVIYEV